MKSWNTITLTYNGWYPLFFNLFLVNWLKPFQFQKNLYICFECRLFPLREQGLNFYAKELTTCEIEVKHLIHNVMLIFNHLNQNNFVYLMLLIFVRFCKKNLLQEFKKTKEAIRRFLLAYKMMLEFFGIKLIDKTGNVARAANWQERFQHLNE